MNEPIIKINIADVLALYRQTKDAIEFHANAYAKAVESAYQSGITGERGYRVLDFSEQTLRNLKVSTWQAIVNVSGLFKVLSVKRVLSLERALNDPVIPEPDEQAVIELLAGGDHKELFAEVVKETFDWLRPGKSCHNPYKTNVRNARLFVGKKVILQGADRTYNRYTTRLHLVCLDRLFHTLDNKPFPYWDSYNSPLADGIGREMVGETEYFKWQRFANGNIHLTFKRLDLLKKFNALASQLVEPALGDEVVSVC